MILNERNNVFSNEWKNEKNERIKDERALLHSLIGV